MLNSSEEFLALIDWLLEDEGPYAVTTDKMSDHSIDELARSRPELVIADIVGTDQVIADRLLRQILDHPDLRGVGIVITSPASPDVREQLKGPRMDPRVSHLPKPFTAAALEELVARLLPVPET